MKWKAKNDTCGVPGRGKNEGGRYINAADFSQEDEDALIKRAKSRGIDVNVFMLGAGFVPVKGPQLEIEMEESDEGETVKVDEGSANSASEEKPKRTRRTKAEIEADKK